jgi:D-lactate dehydrogenase (cytochrome)
MKAIKQALDPYWIMNPGKIMDVPEGNGGCGFGKFKVI